ncbi:MAG: enoyl-CoA hydratase/isomerase family protein, partial [Pseudomonadota bacterium]|nr:enoyl-CoA hydratase/isomerase family protein [Pseudomonadota bacterium]
MSAEEVFLEKKGSLGLITLNRPEALNALTLDMVREIYPKLKLWAEDDEILAVAVQAVGNKAFCAGGDIRALYEWGKDGDERATGFYYEEYLLNQVIKSFPKPYISFVNGIVMGGGVGLSVHGSHRIAGENFSFAMPETGIGLFPDVGGSYFLSRLDNNAGMYLALTGSRLIAADSIYLGIAKYYIESKNYEEIISKLSKGESPDKIIKEYNTEPGISDFKNISEEIEQLFSGNELEEIFMRLENKNSELSQKLYKTILTKSPTS